MDIKRGLMESWLGMKDAGTLDAENRQFLHENTVQDTTTN